MSAAGDLRASDADRERALDALRRHGGEGRLTLEELEERSDGVLAARTRQQLWDLLDDLPAERRTPTMRGDPGLRSHLTVYLAVNGMLIAIWALTGMGYFWPIWPMMGWGIGLASHAAGSRGRSAKAARRHKHASSRRGVVRSTSR